MNDLPLDIIEIVSSFMNIKDNIKLSACNKYLHGVLSSKFPYTKELMKRKPKTNKVMDVGIFEGRIIDNEAAEYWAKSCFLKGCKGLQAYVKQCIIRYNLDCVRNELTPEQKMIVNNELQNDILVQAFAGTGKTTTLKEITMNHKNKKTLYIAYNKSLCEDAITRFAECSWVKVSTVHSLAWQSYNNINVADLNPNKLMRMYDISQKDAISYIDEFNEYCNSLCEPSPNVERIWNDMMSNTLPMTHDAYLKMFQLSNPVLNYDVILLDEVQDCTDVILDIVCKQRSVKVFVGDSCQKIYGFKHVKDPFRYIHDNCANVSRYTLSVSFRMGFDLMYKTNQFLQSKLMINKGFTSCKDHSTEVKVYTSANESENIVAYANEKTNITYICRNNITLYNMMMYLIENTTFNINVYGTIFDIDKEISIVQDFISIEQGRQEDIMNQECKAYMCIDSACKYYHNYKMRGMYLRAVLFKEYGHILVYLWSTLRERLHKTERVITLSTVHQAKGSEFEHVMLGNDFVFNGNDSYRLLYVAMTRATRSILLNRLLISFYTRINNSIYYLSSQMKSTINLCDKCSIRASMNNVIYEDNTSNFTGKCDILVQRDLCVRCLS